MPIDEVQPWTPALVVRGRLDEQVIGDEYRCAVQRALVSMTDEQAAVIVYRLDGYQLGEIAALMDRTEGAVKALLHRGRATLKLLLGMNEGAPTP